MTKTNKDPLVKISKRQNLALQYKLLLTVGAIILSLALGALLLACLGYNPFEFYVQLILGNFKNASYLKLLIRTLIPLLITSLGVSLAFKMRFWNIGAEGQFIIGAIIAMTFSLFIGDSLPSPLGAIVIVLLGALGGGIYALFVALLKVKYNTNETLMTLMLNYVALYLASYMLKTDFYAIQGQGVPSFKVIAESLWLTEISIGKFSFDTALFVAIALVIILFVYFKQSKQGYELNVVGDSPNTAKYAGMKVKWIIVRTMFLSGAIIGMAGALKLCGSSAGHTFSANITGGVGWTSIIVAWLAKLNPIGIFIASLLMSILERGCEFARTSMNMNSAISDVLQGIILFTVLACDFFIGYKVSFRKKAKPGIATEDNGDVLKETPSVQSAEENVSSDFSCEEQATVSEHVDIVTENIEEIPEAVSSEASESLPEASLPDVTLPSVLTEESVPIDEEKNAQTNDTEKEDIKADKTEKGEIKNKTAAKKASSKKSSASAAKTAKSSKGTKSTTKKTSEKKTTKVKASSTRKTNSNKKGGADNE